MHFRLVGFNCRYTHSCLPLYYLRAALEKYFAGAAQVHIDERTINDPYYEILLSVTDGPVDALFLSVYIWNEALVSRLIEDIRTILPELPIVVGGPQITHGEGQSYHRLVTLVKGEVEGLPAAFFADLAGKKLRSVYRSTAEAAFPYPYKKGDFSTQLTNRSLYYEASRGCPFSCTYCLSSIEKGMRVKELNEVEKELTGILDGRPKTVRFVDRTFNVNPERTLRLWNFLAAHEGETVFHFEMAPDRFSNAMFAFLRTVPPGKFRFEVGLQTTTPEALAAVHRAMDMDKAFEAIRALREMDTVHLHVDLILGLPYETGTTFRHSFNEVFRLQPHYIQMGLLKILPGTEMEAKKEEYGILCCSQPPYELLASRWMDRETLACLYLFGKAVEAVCNNRFFRSFLDWLRRHERDPSAVFLEIMDIFRRPEFTGRARTQELVSRVLCRFAQNKKPRRILFELLRYDWLRTGQRFLPGHLALGDERLLRDEVSRRLPQNLEPLYDYRQRNEFIKRAMFLTLSAGTLTELGIDGKEKGCLCLLPEKEAGVLGLQKTLWLTFA